MILIAANRWNRHAEALAMRWQAHDARLLTAQDLSTSGWRSHLNGSDDNLAVVQAKPVPPGEITAILTLMPCIFSQELVDIAPEERSYVASEMTAFLKFWLSGQSCPVLNKPTIDSLAGPAWTQEKWIHVAAQAGIPVQPVHRRAAPSSVCNKEDSPPSLTTLTVIGKHILGEADIELHHHARRLADLATVELLSAHFDSPEPGAHLVSANTYPNLSDDQAADATLELLQSEPKP